MKAPDKICIRKDDTAPFGLTPHWIYTIKVREHDIEYIRKDALLEWLEKKVNISYGVATEAFVEMIDKLNEM